MPGRGVNFTIVKNWDRTITSLQQSEGIESLALQIGFGLPSLVQTLNLEFPNNLTPHAERDATGEKNEDILSETIVVNERPLERLLVTAYPPAAKSAHTEMTKFNSGGEVILITEGEAEITYAPGVTGEFIPRSALKRERVSKGDLILSTDAPNNWTKILGDKFTFIYFVGNPNGTQVYSAIPKEKIPVR